MPPYSDYDRFAWVYNLHWGSFSVRVVPILEKLLLPHLSPESHILDLCCGTGQLAHDLTQRGYKVTGIDGSPEMLHFARHNAPAADFISSDARTFSTDAQYHAVVSVFDSLNHVLELAELTNVFRNVFAALVPQGLFLFDLNMESGFVARWRGTFAIVRDDHVVVARSAYNAELKEGVMDFTLFRLEENWQRTDIHLTQRAYIERDITQALALVGFSDIKTYDAEHDLAFTGNPGRTFFVCRK
ncbi:MAG: class I SAM-dependent methyltransferase [Anaerolineae bacterium]